MREQVTDERRAAELIANFIKGGTGGREELELDAWLQADDSRLELFDRLTSGNAEEWKIVWFRDRGVDAKFLKKKRIDWYKPPKDPAVERAFYKGAAIATVCLLLMYFLLRLLGS